MKHCYLIFTFIVLFCSVAHATVVDLPDGAGQIDITNRVVTVLTKKAIPDGEYIVIVNGKKVVVVFSGGRGMLK
ncbi:hypothetical protein NOVO_00480 [Rickettsiales bacterium Ac37b]|nr:hypothetical protein NOVO_00480 [Rickettsiales bacterium Ac37b]